MKTKIFATAACFGVVAIAMAQPVPRGVNKTEQARSASKAESTPGVSKTELTLGTVQDLSGPLAAYGKNFRNGMLMRMEEANEQGGIYGRQVKLLVEDHGYDPKRAVLAVQKLITQGNGVFAIVGHMGATQNLAALPLQLESGVINFGPLTAAREMYEPFNRLKFSSAATNFDQVRLAAARLVKDRNLRRPCVIYQDDEYGIEVLRGTEEGLRSVGVPLVEKTSYKRGATDFSAQVAAMKAASCDLVVLGTVIRETVGTVAEARKTGFSPVFVGPSAVYSELIPKLGGKAMDGLYATMTAQHPYMDAGELPVRRWAAKYRTRFDEDPSVLSVYGYTTMEAFFKALSKAGPQLTTDQFVRAVESTTFPRDMFGTAEQNFTSTKRLGSRYSRLSQLQDGRWTVVSDYVAFGGLKPTLGSDGRWTVRSEFFKD